MARGNMLLGYARGRVGSVVFKRVNGQQVETPYVNKINDATTRAQVAQRSKLGNIVSSYRAYRTLLQRAFESRAIGQTDYNVFASLNLGTSQVFLTKDAVAAGACVVAPYGVTRGSLPTIQVVEQVAGTFTSDIVVGAGFMFNGDTTVAGFSAAVLDNNQDWVEGDQLTIVHAEQWVQAGTGFPMTSVRLYEVVLSLTNGDFLVDYLPASVAENISGFLGMESPAFIGGVTVIHSRKLAGGALKVSSQRILLSLSDSIYAQYSGASAESVAVTTRGFNQGAYLNPDSFHGSAGESPVGPGVATVATFTVESMNALTAYDLNLYETQQIVVTGTGLSENEPKIQYMSGSVVALAAGLNDVVITPTRITGVWGAGDVAVRKLIASGNVVKEWDEDVVDPGA